MAENKKQLFHSELVKMGTIKVTVKSDVLKSKFKNQNNYVVLLIDRAERNYLLDTTELESWFDGLKGRTFTLLAEGSTKDGTAQLTYVGEAMPEAPGNEPADEPAGRPPAKPRSVKPPAQPPRGRNAAPPPREGKPRQTATPPATGARRADPVDTVINMKRFMARRGNALRLAADESLRLIREFSEAHGVKWTPEIQAGIVQQIAESMTTTTYTTLFLSADLFRKQGDLYMLDDFPATGNFSELLQQARERVEAARKTQGK